MAKNPSEAFASADWKELTPRLLYYGDKLIRQCVWRGLTVNARSGAKLCVEGSGADDLLQEAINRLLNGRRTYNNSVSLEQNLRGTIKSMVWSLNKSSLRTPLIEIIPSERSDESPDPITQTPSSVLSPDASAMGDEAARDEKRILEEFEKSLISEKDLLSILHAYKAGHAKPAAVEKFTGIPASRISELKRKLRGRMEQFEARSTRNDIV